MSDAVPTAAKATPLAGAQSEMGARFASFFGWEMAESFSDLIEEHRAVRQSAGLIDLTYHGVLRLGGAEAAQFLHAVVTNDVKSLVRGKGMRAAFLTGKGKVMGFCRILGLGEGEYLIINDPQTHDRVFNYLFPMTYAGAFSVEDATKLYRVLSVQGPNSLLVMKETSFEPVPSLGEHDWIETIIGGQHIMVARISRTGEQGYDLLVPTPGVRDVWDFLLLKGAFHSIKPVGQAALDVARIEAGIPVYGQDIDDSNMMLEAGMTDAVSFTKGCYTGQEAVAMATYRGHVSKRLSGLLLEGERVPSRGDQVLKDDKEVGSVTSAVHSPSLNRPVALALVKYGFFDPRTTLQVQCEDQTVSATVVDLPFHKAS
jgi:glycine cleavage system T protein